MSELRPGARAAGRRRWRRRWLGGPLVLAALSAGCGGDETSGGDGATDDAEIVDARDADAATPDTAERFDLLEPVDASDVADTTDAADRADNPDAAETAERADSVDVAETAERADSRDGADAADADERRDGPETTDVVGEPDGAEAADGPDADTLDAADRADDLEVSPDADAAADADTADLEELIESADQAEVEGERHPGEGYIGGACVSVDDCWYLDAICLDDAAYPDGLCTLDCDRLCPDSDDPGDAVTFCIEDPDDTGAGICVSQCDTSLFPGGCREAYRCVTRGRFQEPATTRQVCLPPGDEPERCTADDVPQPNAGLVEPPGEQGCPDGMTTLEAGGAVCIDRFEAHLVELLPGGESQPWSPYFNPEDRDIRAQSAPGAVPQGYITGVQAGRACAAADKRLCTRAEWERACRGAAQRTYPYGDTRQPGVCNDARAQHPAIEYFGTSDAWIWSELGHPCLNQLADGLALTGAHPDCVTPEGVLDLMGNLHEWIDDPAGTFKGGFYVDTVINGDGCLYTTTAHSTGHWDYSTGFRCCADR